MSSPFLPRAAWILPLVLLGLGSVARAETIDVVVAQFQFTGQHLTIQLGDTVRWIGAQSGHTTTEGTDLVVNGNEAWHEQLSLNEVFSVTFNAAFLAAHPRVGDEYHYFCVPHGAAMRGSIKVVTGPGLPFCFCSPLGPCSNRDYGAGCVNSTMTRGGRMLGSGSTSVAADDLLLTVDRLPANKPAILISGKSLIAQTQIGEGWRCIGSPFFRMGTGSTGPNGVVSRGPGLVVQSYQSQAKFKSGQTWRFQLWYRDSAIGCGETSNISNGYVVTFTP
ncbi:MAG: plastocyanin/azurin family copper-binding protein [Planctomycetota bacterium]